MFKTVFYDLGDIFFEAHYWRKWMYDQLKEKYFSGSFTDFYHFYEESLKSVYENKLSYDQNYRQFLETLKIPDPDKFMNESFLQKKFFEESRKLFPEVKETLQRLYKNNIKNVIITDNEAGESEIRHNLLARFDIDLFITKIVSSKELGITKPDPKIFSHALEICESALADSVFVAHDADEIEGAKNFGFKVIEFNNYLNIFTNADYKISHFREVYDIVTSTI